MKVPFLELKSAYDELKTEIDAAYHRVMDSGWYLFGKEIETFEAEYAKSIGVTYCIGVANGLDALKLILMAMEIGPEDEVIVPSNTYIATWLAVSSVGAKIVPCEPDLSTGNIDAEKVAALISKRTRAIFAVHLYGQCCDMTTLRRVAEKHDVLVLEDAAQSHGATWKGIQSGALGFAAGVSFYPGKNLGAFADAGAVTTNDVELAKRVRHLRNYGAEVKYKHDFKGVNSRLSELQAAFLRARLACLAEWNSRRTKIAEFYNGRLSGIEDLSLPHVLPDAVSSWHLYVLKTPRRHALQTFLAERGVASQIYYPTPPHLSGAYADEGWKRGDFPLAEKHADEVLSLPIGPHHTLEQVSYVCDVVRDFFKS